MPTIEYQVHVADLGWLLPASLNGATAGTTGEGIPIQAITIRLIDLPGASVSYNAYVQNLGWQGWVSDGETAGTVGQGLSLEALQINIKGVSYGVIYQAHVQNLGWQEWAADGADAGTTDQSLAMEAIKIALAYTSQ